jgi:acetyltransferase
MISRTQVFKLLRGYRDRPAADLEAISRVIVQVAQLIIDRPEIVELDINPLFADDQGVLALDARIRVVKATTTGPQRLAIRPYPRELEETIRLPSGREVLLRPIRPEDQPAHRRFIERLTPEDLRFRFLGVTRDIPPKEMARLVQIDYDREMAFIATAPGDQGEDETLAVARTVTNPDAVITNFAVMVRSDLKRSGLGSAMLRKLIAYCRNRGIRELVGEVLANNQAMLALGQKLGFQITPLPKTDRCELRLRLNISPT